MNKYNLLLRRSQLFLRISRTQLLLKREKLTTIVHAVGLRVSHSVTDLITMRALHSSPLHSPIKEKRDKKVKSSKRSSAVASTTSPKVDLIVMAVTRTLPGDDYHYSI